MVQTIYWVEPTNTGVGSVLIYRADTYKADTLGSRTIITTIGAKTVGSAWVNSYTDASGTADHIYRVQFWDGIGSSPLSDPMGREFSDQLATYDDVIRLARLRNYYEVGSGEVYDAINDASEEIFYHYGDPIKKTAFFLDNKTGVIGQAYNFTGDYGPVYQVRRVLVDSLAPDIVPGTDYEIDFADGSIKFTDSFINTNSGKYVFVHWVPSVINVLVKNMAALNLLEGELLTSGVNASNPQVERLKRKTTDIIEYLRPKGVYGDNSFVEIAEYEIIPQKTDRTSLYFS